MKSAISFTRVTLFLIFSFFLMEWIVDSGNEWAIVKYPIIWGVLGILLLVAIIFEVMLGAVERVLFLTLDEAAKGRYLSADEKKDLVQDSWMRRTYTKLLGSTPMEKEQEIVLDHNYDGIRELDNDLPPWWVYMFYASIVFAVIYFLRYEVFDGTNQIQEYEIEVAQAKAELEEYKRNNKDLIDAESVELMTDPKDLAMGKAIYTDNCIACHKDNGGGGIGPNLTDDYWILGGGIKNIYHTISEGGRPGKGMVAWKSELKPSEMAQVASYVMSLHGTNPPDAKAAEGDLWTE
jgi:cytochrome c oxidase cbb3-type subunit 3